MPIYEYQCQECETVFEQLVLPRDPEPTECKSCDGKIQRLISHTSFTLKGGGWYVTDYKHGRKTSYTNDDSPSDDAVDAGLPATGSTPSAPADSSSSSGTSESSGSPSGDDAA